MYYCQITQTERIKGKESKMKLEDIEVGQTVIDKFGNEYTIAAFIGKAWVWI